MATAATKLEWVDRGRNETMEVDGAGFYLSYNWNTAQDALGSLWDALATVESGPETAICVDGERMQFYILRGDHREQLAARYPNLGACVEYFVQHIDEAGDSSDFPPGS